MICGSRIQKSSFCLYILYVQNLFGISYLLTVEAAVESCVNDTGDILHEKQIHMVCIRQNIVLKY